MWLGTQWSPFLISATIDEDQNPVDETPYPPHTAGHQGDKQLADAETDLPGIHAADSSDKNVEQPYTEAAFRRVGNARRGIVTKGGAGLREVRRIARCLPGSAVVSVVRLLAAVLPLPRHE